MQQVASIVEEGGNGGPAWSGLDFAAFEDGEALRTRYDGARPFPHVVLDDRFPPALLDEIRHELAAVDADPEKNFYGSFNKRRLSKSSELPALARRLIEDLNSAPFLQFLEKMTGIKGLIPDPYLEGGGIHQIGTGGFLKVHTDFNWHRRLKLHRRLNLLLYLNDGWQDGWNGQLELWDGEMKGCVARISPIINRMVVFSTTDDSYHGHPDALTCPSEVRRTSIALYYYSAERPESEIKFGKSEMTNYQERPDEAFSGDAGRRTLHRALIRTPALRRLVKLVSGK